MDIDTAASGLEAIGLTKTIKYDLILMDQRMPGMDGTETMKNIIVQEDGVNRETPFICLTADAVSGARTHYLAEGFTDYLTKPIDSKALERTLMKYLPKEKIITDFKDEEAQEEAFPEVDEFEPMRLAGIDPDVGLRFCQGDKDLYRSIIIDYAQTSDEKMKNIVEYLAKEDWKNYAISVHALKSTSKTIGAGDLSDIALHLEMAANENDASLIRAEHDTMLDLYQKVVAAIRKAEPEAQSATKSEDEALEFSPDDDDVLEFNPY